jgi:hypothetical protein
MGGCMAFNFGPHELREKMIDVKWFVYSPDFDSGFFQEEQNFRTAIDLGDANVEAVKAELIQLFNLKPIPTEKDLLKYSENLNFDLVKYDKQPFLYVRLFSTLKWGAMGQAQIDEMKRIDQQLCTTKYKIALPYRQFDYVFGPNYLLAKEFAKKFVNKSKVYIPSQKEWFWGSSISEAIKQMEQAMARR